MLVFENKSKEQTIILAIETSCDETAAAVMADGKLLSSVVHTQGIHQEYGGVVPEIASRAHLDKINSVTQAALGKANVSLHDITHVAVTHAPGLLGALITGLSFAKGLALSLDVPLVKVHHIKAHILAHFLDSSPPEFPFLSLVVSGGHTQLVIVKSDAEMEIIGETLDDAIGEAFDKAAKMMGLPYPGGPFLDKLAIEGNPKKFEFPKPNIEGYNYSFSGLKTALLYFLQKLSEEEKSASLPDICASYQKALVDFLLSKAISAMKAHGLKSWGLAGGVSANSYLRKRFHEIGEYNGWQSHIPAFEYCTDNAAMIAQAAHFLDLRNQTDPLSVEALATLSI